MLLKRRIKQFKKFKAFLGPRVFKLFVAAIGAGVLAFAVEASFVLISQGFLHALGLVDEDKLRLPDFYPRGITASVLLLLLFGLARGAVLGLKKFLAQYTSQAFVVQQRKQLFSYGLLNADKVSSSQVMSVFGDRVREAGTVLQNFSNVAALITSSSLLLIVGFRLAPVELALGLGLLFVVMFPFNRSSKKITQQGKAVLKDWDKTNQHLTSSLKNFFLLKIYKQIEPQVIAGLKSLDNYLRRRKIYLVLAVSKSIAPTIMGTAIIALITLVSLNYIGTEPVLLLAFFYIFVRISQSLGEISFATSALRFNLPSFKELYAWHLQYLQQERVEKARSERFTEVIHGPVHIDLQNVSFRYGADEPWVLQNCSLQAAPGQPLVIKGPSGSGKSTLLKLVLGLEEPQEGQVFFNQVPVVNVDAKFWDKAAYVGPEPFLIEGSLRDNLLYGHPSAGSVTPEQFEIALRKAQLWGEVLSDIAHLDRPLSDHAELSTGQRQRLSIARAFLRDADLYIWDEATANLDHESEKRIIEELKPLLATRTCLIVTHKDSFDEIGTVVFHL